MCLNIKDCIFYSGGADGSDTIWQQELEKLGGKVVAYRPYHIDKLSDSEFKEVDNAYKEVVEKLGRKELPIDRYAGKLVRRDMLQVKNANSIYAIGTINNYNGLINGGTGYSTTRAIIMGLNVYLFEQELVQWMQYSYEEQKFVKCDKKPVLDERSAVVGTREINENGIKAIKDIIKCSFF